MTQPTAVHALEAALERLDQTLSQASGAVAATADEGIQAADVSDVSRFLGALFFELVEGRQDAARIANLAGATSALANALDELVRPRLS